MNLLDQRIRTFASQGLSPYEIEERLGMEHYTIHIEHHHALMEGYARSDNGEKEAERKERRRELNRAYEARHREKHALELSARRKERYWRKKEQQNGEEQKTA